MPIPASSSLSGTTVNPTDSSFHSVALQENETAAKSFDLAMKMHQSSSPLASGYAQKAEKMGEDSAAKAAISQGTAVAEQYGKGGSAFTEHCNIEAHDLRSEAADETGGQKKADIKEANDLQAFAKDPMKYASGPGGVDALAKAGDAMPKRHADGSSSAPVSVGTPASDINGIVMELQGRLS